MNWDKVILSSLEQINYYNNDKGYELAPLYSGFSHARLANIAACLVDGTRFLEYMRQSDDWESDLITAARIFITKPETGIWKHEPPVFQEFLVQLRDNLLTHVPRKRIYRNPQRINLYLDIAGITQMLRQLID